MKRVVPIRPRRKRLVRGLWAGPPAKVHAFVEGDDGFCVRCGFPRGNRRHAGFPPSLKSDTHVDAISG